MPVTIPYARDAQGEYIPAESAVKGSLYSCCECSEKLIFKSGDVKIPHFAHSPGSECKGYGGESLIHREAKEYIRDILLERRKTIYFARTCGVCKKSKKFIIDPLFGLDYSVECEYRFDHAEGKRCADIAITKGGKLHKIIEIFHTSRTRDSHRPDNENKSGWFEVSAAEVLEAKRKLRAGLTSLELTCVRRPKTQIGEDISKRWLRTTCGKPACESAAMNECDKRLDNKIANMGKIYHKQRGAGCGKTYESVQDICNPEFNDKRVFLYITKTHSARNVISEELTSKIEEREGRLKNCRIKEDSGDSNPKLRIIEIYRYNRDFDPADEERYFNEGLFDIISAIICTVDSATYRAADKFDIPPSGNYFDALLDRIIGGKTSNQINERKLYYDRKPYDIDNNTLIIIDEAQDLGPKYVNAFTKIIEKTGADLYVIGDKLQSIYSETNTFNMHHEWREDEQMKDRYICDAPKNIVWRFHRQIHMDMVNHVVPFKDVDCELIPISGICQRDSCELCAGGRQDDCFEVFESPRLDPRRSDPDTDDCIRDIHKSINKDIIPRIEKEIIDHGCTPSDFMYVFSVLSGNMYAKILHERLQMFWIKKSNDEEYKSRIGEENFNKHFRRKGELAYIFLHKSEEGRPIDLTTSKYASRIVSIHAAKGNGAKIVFAFGLNNRYLERFSKTPSPQGKRNLKFESLLHIALTRQMISLYVGVEFDGSDVYRRFKSFLGDKMVADTNVRSGRGNIKDEWFINSLVSYVTGNEEYSQSTPNEESSQPETQNNKNMEKFHTFINDLKKLNKGNGICGDDESSARLVSWEYHEYGFHLQNFYLEIYLSEYVKTHGIGWSQMDYLMVLASRYKIQICKYPEYQKGLKSNREKYNNRLKNVECDDPIIYLPRLSDINDNYDNYLHIIERMMKNIQKRLSKTKKITELTWLICASWKALYLCI